MWKWFRVLVVCCLSLIVILNATAQGKRIVIGVLPVYDNSAQPLTEDLPVNLTFMLYRNLLNSTNFEPVLLSPGGLYDPDSLDWVADYAAKAKIDVVLICSILPALKVNEHRSRLKLEAQLMNVATGKLSAKVLNDTVEISNNDLFSNIAATYVSSNIRGYFKSSEDFDKQPLGKAAVKLVDWTRAYVATAVSTLEVANTGDDPPSKPATCPINFSIKYVKNKSAAKSYTLLANNKDETSTLKDGVAQFPASSGPLALRIQVMDAPYGTKIEKLYQTSTVLDCGGTQSTLVMEMGNAGESFLHWQ